MVSPWRRGGIALIAALLGCGSAPAVLHLNRVLPAEACPGDRLDLYGGGFGSATSSSFVTLAGHSIVPLAADGAGGDGGGSGRVLDWEANHIAFLVPAVRGGQTLLTVTVGGAVSNALGFEVATACPGSPDAGRPDGSASEVTLRDGSAAP